MPTLVFEHFHHCCILVQNHQTATDDEWRSWLQFVQHSPPALKENLRILILSAGGTPTPTQRSQVHALMPKSGDGVLTAVVTASFIGQTIVRVMSMFNRNVRPFSSRIARDAFEYLGVPRVRHTELMEVLRRMHQRLDIEFRVELG
jgi:hypothetical protein